VTQTGFCSGISDITELAGTLVCPKFNTQAFPFTLLSMTLEISGGISGTIELTNNASTTQNTSGTTNSQFFASPLTGFSFSSPLFTASFSTGVQSISAGGSYASPSLDSGTQTTGQMAANPASLGNYQFFGVDTFGIDISTLTGIAIVGGGGQIGSDQFTEGFAEATVRYTYDDGTVLTPEPATIAVLGMGLLALGAARRRRQG
jgi:hypothetical protein